MQARLDAQRDAILDATGRIMAQHGFAGCSIAAVAAEAGIAAGTVYNHFDGKSDLLAEVFRILVGREVEAVRAVVTVRSDSVEKATSVVETFAGRAMKSPRLAFALLAEPVEPAVVALRLEYGALFRDLFVELIEEGMRTGEVPPQNSGVVASALVGAIDAALVRPLLAGRAGPDTISTLITFVVRALGAHDAADRPRGPLGAEPT